MRRKISSQAPLTPNDPAVNVAWPVSAPILSAKDAQGHSFSALEVVAS